MVPSFVLFEFHAICCRELNMKIDARNCVDACIRQWIDRSSRLLLVRMVPLLMMMVIIIIIFIMFIMTIMVMIIIFIDIITSINIEK